MDFRCGLIQGSDFISAGWLCPLLCIGSIRRLGYLTVSYMYAHVYLQTRVHVRIKYTYRDWIICSDPQTVKENISYSPLLRKKTCVHPFSNGSIPRPAGTRKCMKGLWTGRTIVISSLVLPLPFFSHTEGLWECAVSTARSVTDVGLET